MTVDLVCVCVKVFEIRRLHHQFTKFIILPYATPRDYELNPDDDFHRRLEDVMSNQNKTSS